MAKEGVGWIQECTPVIPGKAGQRTLLLMGSKSPAVGPGWGGCGLLAGLRGGLVGVILDQVYVYGLPRMHSTVVWRQHLAYAVADKPLEALVDGLRHPS